MNIRIILWVRRGEGVEASPPPAKPTRAQRKRREELGTTGRANSPSGGRACCQQLGGPARTTHRPEPMGQPPRLPGELGYGADFLLLPVPG